MQRSDCGKKQCIAYKKCTQDCSAVRILQCDSNSKIKLQRAHVSSRSNFIFMVTNMCIWHYRPLLPNQRHRVSLTVNLVHHFSMRNISIIQVCPTALKCQHSKISLSLQSYYLDRPRLVTRQDIHSRYKSPIKVPKWVFSQTERRTTHMEYFPRLVS